MDKKALRKALIQQRLDMPDRAERADLLQRVLRIWLFDRKDMVIGAYWPIKGEFDPLPALHRWKEDGELLDDPLRRRIGLPVVDKVSKTLRFHAWYPGCDMEEDDYNIPKPKDTEVVVPTLLVGDLLLLLSDEGEMVLIAPSSQGLAELGRYCNYGRDTFNHDLFCFLNLFRPEPT